MIDQQRRHVVAVAARPFLRLGSFSVAGALMACATPPMNLYPMTWIGLIAFAWMLGDVPRDAPNASRSSSVLRGSLRGFLFGFGTNLVALRFIAPVVTRFSSLPHYAGPLALVVISAFEAIRWIGAALICEWLAQLRVPRALAFAIGVYGGTFIPTMIPWTVACGVCPWPATVQLAELAGERGVAMLLALQAAFVAEGFDHLLRDSSWSARNPGAGARRERWRRAGRAWGAASMLVLLSLAYGAVRISQIDDLRAASPTGEVALITPAVDASVRWDPARAPGILSRLTELTIRAEGEGADLTIWPEAAYPFHMEHVSRHAPTGVNAIVQPAVHGPVLTGLIMLGDFGKYNSAVIATNDGMVSEPYDKMHLMWFGEMVPLAEEFPWLRKVFARGAGLRAGERSVALESGGIRAAPLNCLEDILPAAGREAMSVRPNLLVNLTNDAWFEGSAESELHLRLGRLRSIELRRDMVRAVNYGPTTWIDAVGRVRARMSGDKPGILMTEPALLDGPMTAYATYGDLPLGAVSGVYVLGALMNALLGFGGTAKNRKNKRRVDATSFAAPPSDLQRRNTRGRTKKRSFV